MSAIIYVNRLHGSIDADMDSRPQATTMHAIDKKKWLRQSEGSKLNGRVSLMYMSIRTTKSHISLNNCMI